MQKNTIIAKTTIAVNTECLSLLTSLKVQKSPEVRILQIFVDLWECKDV